MSLSAPVASRVASAVGAAIALNPSRDVFAPSGFALVIDDDGNFYVDDYGNHIIKEI